MGSAAGLGGGARGTFDAETARSEGLIKSIAGDRAQVARIYDVPAGRRRRGPGRRRACGRSGCGSTARSNGCSRRISARQLGRARQMKANLLIMQLDSPGGQIRPADDMAELILGPQGHPDRRLCPRPRHRGLGPDRDGQRRDHASTRTASSARSTRDLAGRDRLESLEPEGPRRAGRPAGGPGRPRGRSPAVARAMAMPDVELVEALDRDAGAVVIVDREDIAASRIGSSSRGPSSPPERC